MRTCESCGQDLPEEPEPIMQPCTVIGCNGEYVLGRYGDHAKTPQHQNRNRPRIKVDGLGRQPASEEFLVK